MTEDAWREARAGLRDIAPAVIAAAPIGLVYGALAVSKGMSPLEVGLMSALVFAGGSQFAAVELWAQPVPVLTIVLSTLLINSRLLLMSASLAPKARHLGTWQRWFCFYVLADENWAFAEQRAARHNLTAPYFVAMCSVFFLNWVVFSVAGAVLGPLLGDPARFGGDFVFTALFIGLIAGFWRGASSGLIIAAAGLVSAFVWATIGSPWHVPAGALAGIAVAALAPQRSEGAAA
jgi:4-azaleucine resistance transporter AzlC